MRCDLIRWILVAVVGMVCGAAPVPSIAAEFYVSPGGSDDWSGTQPDPNAERTDGPFASLAARGTRSAS